MHRSSRQVKAKAPVHTARRNIASKKPSHPKKVAPVRVNKRHASTAAHKVDGSEFFAFEHTLSVPQARSYRVFKNEPVDPLLIKRAYDEAKNGPSAFNGNPLRITLLNSEESRNTFATTTLGTNGENMKKAPVVALLSYDLDFWKRLPELSPNYDGGYQFYKNTPEAVPGAAQLNGHLQAGYFLLSLRALGLDIGPASGFDNVKADELLHAGNETTKNWKSFMYVNIGHGEPTSLFGARDPRPSYESVSVQI